VRRPDHLYSFSFAPEGDWSRRFAPQEEIHAYLRKVAADFDVVRHVRFRHEVLSATWADASQSWTLAAVRRHDSVVRTWWSRVRPAERSW
jgi:cation diffusion facilitator CzcD-associated flavoprotein CzcO